MALEKRASELPKKGTSGWKKVCFNMIRGKIINLETGNIYHMEETASEKK